VVKDPRVNAAAGTLNDDTIDFNSPRISLDNVNSTNVVQEMIGDYIAPKVSLDYPRKAVVIDAIEINANPDKSYGTVLMSYVFGENIKYIAVTAYDDFVDSLIDMPDTSKPEDEMSFYDRSLTLCLKQTSMFYGEIGGGTGPSEMPKKGDIVWIDYDDRANKRGGIYKGIALRTKALPVTPGSNSAKDAHDSATGPIETIASKDSGNIGITPPYASIDDLCKGPTMERGSRYGGGEVETVVIDGAPVAVDVAGFYLEMRNAAQDDGVTLKISSAFRGNKDVDTSECGGRLKKGQQSLWDQNCYDKVTRARKECDPVTARVGRSPHQNGVAFDMALDSINLPRDSPRPDSIHSSYRWLMLHAWKYGFIRNVPSERWHWEYRPGASQFGIVKKDHPTWDNFYLTGEGAATV